MLCPRCMIQMHQYRELGNGKSEEDYYETWTMQECPGCGRIYKEFYSAELSESIKSEEL